MDWLITKLALLIYGEKDLRRQAKEKSDQLAREAGLRVASTHTRGNIYVQMGRISE